MLYIRDPNGNVDPAAYMKKSRGSEEAVRSADRAHDVEQVKQP
jgi:hypothetical protein